MVIQASVKTHADQKLQRQDSRLRGFKFAELTILEPALSTTPQHLNVQVRQMQGRHTHTHTPREKHKADITALDASAQGDASNHAEPATIEDSSIYTSHGKKRHCNAGT
eukprot:3508169-Amphidinium_carterae.1